jgi:hypothetical protein
MIVPYEKTGGRDDGEKEKKNSEKPDGMNPSETCRCKETSKMTPGELLKLMIKDLASWRRAKRD